MTEGEANFSLTAVTRRITLRGYACAFISYGQINAMMAQGLQDLGFHVSFRPQSVFRDIGGQIMEPPDVIRQTTVNTIQPEALEVFIHPPLEKPTPGKKTAFFTMWETTQLPAHVVENLNLADLVIVPCDWNVPNFKASGVKPPVEVCPLGIDMEIFRYRPANNEALCTFGAGGRIIHGPGRKSIADVLEAFQATFFEKEYTNVRLKIKGFADDPPIEFTDPRIELNRSILTDKQMADWFGSIDCLVSTAKSEGWGFMQHQAMAVGRPVIASLFGGLTMFASPKNAYPVNYEMCRPQPGDFYTTGFWCQPQIGDVMRQMMRVYTDRNEARRIGRRASADVQRFSIAAMAERLVEILDKHALL